MIILLIMILIMVLVLVCDIYEDNIRKDDDYE